MQLQQAQISQLQEQTSQLKDENSELKGQVSKSEAQDSENAALRSQISENRGLIELLFNLVNPQAAAKKKIITTVQVMKTDEVDVVSEPHLAVQANPKIDEASRPAASGLNAANQLAAGANVHQLTAECSDQRAVVGAGLSVRFPEVNSASPWGLKIVFT